MFGSVDGSDRRGHLSSDGLLYNLVMNGVDTYDNMRSWYGTFDHGHRGLEGSTGCVASDDARSRRDILLALRTYHLSLIISPSTQLKRSDDGGENAHSGVQLCSFVGL
jgi:hypothetical protein